MEYLTVEQKKQFLKMLPKCGYSEALACQECDISWVRFVREKKSNNKFRELLGIMREKRDSELEHYYIHRLKHGHQKPVWWQGNIVGYEQVFETSLANQHFQHIVAKIESREIARGAKHDIITPQDQARRILECVQQMDDLTVNTDAED